MSASVGFIKKICYNARSHERKILIYTLRCTNFTGVEKKREITESGILFDLYPCEQRAEVFATMTRRNAVNWDTRPCSRVDIYQIF